MLQGRSLVNPTCHTHLHPCAHYLGGMKADAMATKETKGAYVPMRKAKVAQYPIFHKTQF